MNKYIMKYNNRTGCYCICIKYPPKNTTVDTAGINNISS